MYSKKFCTQLRPSSNLKAGQCLKFIFFKSCIQETPTLSTDADSSTDIRGLPHTRKGVFFLGGGGCKTSCFNDHPLFNKRAESCKDSLQ